MSGLVYLVQPPQCIGTTCFKIGMSKSNTIRRIRDYGSGCINIISRECTNPRDVEKELIELFNAQFGAPVKGREWFSGSKLEMINAYNDCFERYAICDELSPSRPSSEIKRSRKRVVKQPEILYKPGAMTKLSDLKSIDSKLTAKKLLEMNPEWTISPKKSCKHCGKRHYKGCCDCYSRDNRITCDYVNNIQIAWAGTVV
jgi:hypothetical protein